MEYNTTRGHLIISEYGRNIQKLIAHIATIEDKEKRSETAQAVVKIMSQINYAQKNIPEFDHKLWDHLQIIGGLKLDIDAPYPAPKLEEVEAKPKPLPYPKKAGKLRHYGKNLETLINKAVEEKDKEKQEALTEAIANYMKMAYRNWNQENISNEVVTADIARYSDNKLSLNEDFNFSAPVATTKRKNYSQNKNGRNNNRRTTNKRKY